VCVINLRYKQAKAKKQLKAFGPICVAQTQIRIAQFSVIMFVSEEKQNTILLILPLFVSYILSKNLIPRLCLNSLREKTTNFYDLQKEGTNSYQKFTPPTRFIFVCCGRHNCYQSP
jgi:hypothetical protein